MLNRWTVLTCMLFAGCFGTAYAAPLDSPGTTYIDGLPCNNLCQSYMAWSRNSSAFSAQSTHPRPSIKAASHQPITTPRQKSKAAGQAPSAKLTIPTPKERTAEVRLTANANSDPTGSRAAVSPLTGGSSSKPRTVQEQIEAATRLAEHVTAVTVSTPQGQQANDAYHSEIDRAGDGGKIAAEPAGDPDVLVALLLARPEIKSLSDLNGKDVEIENGPLASNDRLRTAIVAAGAPDVRLNDDNTRPIDRVINGEVSAAVLALVSQEAADWFPDIRGYKIFRIPLPSRSLKAKLE